MSDSSNMSSHAVKPKKIWVYGFQPFLHYPENITQKVIAQLEAEQCFGNVNYSVLAVDFQADIFEAPLRAVQPDVVLGMGQYPRGQKIRIERKAFNWQRDKSNPDHAEGPILSTGQALERPSWNIKPDTMSWRSYNAGRYVCNYSMYQLSRWARLQHFNYAFIHIPKDFCLEHAVGFVKKHLNNQGALPS